MKFWVVISFFSVFIVGFSLLSWFGASEEGSSGSTEVAGSNPVIATESNEWNEVKTVNPSAFTAKVRSVALPQIPQELHALSAIELSHKGSFAEVSSLSKKTVSFPLNTVEAIDLSIKKSVTNGGRDIVIGSVEGHEKSSFQLIFRDGELSAGHVHFFETNEHYKVSTTADWSLLVSLNDSDRDLSTCGCTACNE